VPIFLTEPVIIVQKKTTPNPVNPLLSYPENYCSTINYPSLKVCFDWTFLKSSPFSPSQASIMKNKFNWFPKKPSKYWPREQH